MLCRQQERRCNRVEVISALYSNPAYSNARVVVISEDLRLDTARCFSLFDYSSVEEAIHVLKLMLAKNCYGIFRFGPSARGL